MEVEVEGGGRKWREKDERKCYRRLRLVFILSVSVVGGQAS